MTSTQSSQIEKTNSDSIYILLIDLTSEIRSKIYKTAISFRPIDQICLRESISRLEQRQQQEESLTDIIATTGYNIIDEEIIDLDEWKEGDSPYTGDGENAGKYSGFGHYQSLKAYQHRRAIMGLAQEVSEHAPRTVVEIGSANGGTFYVWNRFFESANEIVSLDKNFPGQRRKFFNTFNLEVDTTFIEGDVFEEATRSKLAAIVDEIDFLYVDPPHSYEAHKEIFDMYSDLVASGGLLGFHDVSHPGSRCPELWSQFENEYKTKTFGVGPTKNGLIYL